MELTDRQRRLAFVVLVLALAAVGIYLTVPSGAAPGRPAGGAPSPGAGTGVPAGSTPTPSPATPVARGASPSPSPSGFDIYPLLPFDRAEFAAAADLARRFTAAYGTYRYDEEPRAHLARLDGMMSPDLRAEVERGAASPGLIEQRKQEQAVATSEATVDSIRDVEKSSIIFLVTGRQQVTRTGNSSETKAQYAVTVSREGSDWKVYSFQPAEAGQAGDTG
jgi:hypothetical protein